MPARRLTIAVVLLATAAARAEPSPTPSPISETRLELLFRPPLGERMTMSPDGRYLAYTERAGTNLMIEVMDLATMTRKTRIIADEDRPILHSKEKARAQLRFFRWAAGDRLVFAPTIETVQSASQPPRQDTLDLLGEIDPEASAFMRSLDAAGPVPPAIFAPVMAVDADGSNPLQLVDAKDFQVVPESGPAITRPPRIKGFLGGDRSRLLIEVTGGGEPPTLFSVEVKTGQREIVHREQLAGAAIYDWRGQARLNRVSKGDQTPELFYRVGDKGRWGRLEPPAGAKDPVRFDFSLKNYFGQRAIPLGLDFQPEVLLYAANFGRDTFGVYALDLKTWQPTPLKLEHPRFDLAALDAGLPSASLVFDEYRQKFAGVRAPTPRPFTAWADEGLAEVQRGLDQKFAPESVEILEWDESRTHFLLRITGGTARGRILLCDLAKKSFATLTHVAPWLPDTELNPTRFFGFDGPDGSRLTGYLTVPRTPKIKPPPLLLWFAPGLPPQPQEDFSAPAQVFADLGFIVCRLNNRGVLGTGLRARDALRRDPNGVTEADALATVDWLAGHLPLDRKRVATYGEGVAGYFAIRVAQLHPEIFRCAAVLDPVLNFRAWLNPVAADGGSQDGANLAPQAWIGGGTVTFAQQVNRLYFEGGGAKLADLTVPTDKLNTPVFFAVHRANTPAETDIAAGAAGLSRRLQRQNIPAETVEYDEDFAQGLPAARAAVYRRLDEFFNLNLYRYDVKIGPTQVVK